MLRTILFLLAAALLGLAAGCMPSLPREAAIGAQPDLSGNYYRQAQADGVTVLRVDPARSLLTVEVSSAGSLSALGHDHVVAARTLRGYVAPERNRADLSVDLAQLTVDEPALRAQAGFDSQPSADAIAGTRRNMLERVLEAERFPLAAIRIERIAQREVLRLAITLHGTTREFETPARIEALSDGGMAVSGRMQLRQSDFGITPYAVLGGALAVQDSLDLRFHIVAVR